MRGPHATSTERHLAPKDEGPLFQQAPTLRESIQTLVAFVDDAPAWDAIAVAVRQVLAHLKERALVEREAESLIRQMRVSLDDSLDMIQNRTRGEPNG